MTIPRKTPRIRRVRDKKGILYYPDEKRPRPKEKTKAKPPNVEEDHNDEWGMSGSEMTLDSLAALQPFTESKIGQGESVPVGFRIPAELLREIQRLKERNPGIYDIMSDLYRDALTVGFYVLHYRYQRVLPVNAVLAFIRQSQRTKADVESQVHEVAVSLQGGNKGAAVEAYLMFMETVGGTDKRTRRLFVSEMDRYPIFKEFKGIE
jgi:hypothetical protein